MPLGLGDQKEIRRKKKTKGKNPIVAQFIIAHHSLHLHFIDLSKATQRCGSSGNSLFTTIQVTTETLGD